MQVAIEQIAIINRQRRDLDQAKIMDLAQSIKESGLLHPIVLRHPHEGEDTGGLPYVLVVGGRRLAAHILLGLESIPATLKEGMDPLSSEIAELDENLRREAISWQDEVDAKARIHILREIQNPMQTLTMTAEEIGEDKSNLSRDLKLARLLERDPELRKATTKAGAIRQAAFKKNTADKLRNVEAISVVDLRKKLIIADWCDFAATLPDESVDLVLSDLPYAIDQFEVQSAGENHPSKFDDSADTVLPAIERLIPEICRVIKPDGWICLFMSYEFHGWVMDQFSKRGLKPELPPWVWNRSNQPGNYGHYPELHAANRYEMLVVVNAGQAKFLKKPIENVLNYASLTKEEKTHNHQKPHELLKELISRFTVPGERVIDFCFGSGAHLAAAADMGRDFAGSESNPALLDAAIVNVSQYYRPRQLGTTTAAPTISVSDDDTAGQDN